MTDEQWALIVDLVQACSVTGKMGRPPKWDRRDIVNAIFYVAATGCQWRALPAEFPHWNTVHRYHVTWSRDGTWEAVVDRLRALVRQRQGRDPEPSAGIVDARSVRGAETVTGDTRGYDAAKKVSGRKTFGVVDTLGLLMAVVVVAASASDNAGGTRVVELAAPKSGRLAKIWHDTGFKPTFSQFCRRHEINAELVSRTNAHTFDVLPRRWMVERTWGWLVHHRRHRGGRGLSLGLAAQAGTVDGINIDKPGRPVVGTGSQGGGLDDVSGYYVKIDNTGDGYEDVAYRS